MHQHETGEDDGTMGRVVQSVHISVWTVLSVDPSCALESVMGVRDKTKSHIHPYAGRTEHRTRRPALNGNRMRHAPRRSRVASHAATSFSLLHPTAALSRAHANALHTAPRAARAPERHTCWSGRESGGESRLEL